VNAVNVLEIPQDILDTARLTFDELKVEMVVYLYAQGRLSIGKACELAGMTLWEFRQLLVSRRIPPHYDVADLGEDVAPVLERFIHNRLDSRTLANLRDTLPPKLISGELRVPDTMIEYKE
jgi:predicted HTH domain antitoxin